MSDPKPATAEAEPTESEIKSHCKNGHRWREVWPMPMTLTAFAKRMKGASICPHCNGTAYLGWPEENETT